MTRKEYDLLSSPAPKPYCNVLPITVYSSMNKTMIQRSILDNYNVLLFVFTTLLSLKCTKECVFCIDKFSAGIK